MTNIIENLTASIQKHFPESEVDVTVGGSGAFFVHISLGKRLFVVEHLPEHGFGVSELAGGAEDWLSGHEDVFQEYGEAEEHLLRKVAR